MLIPTLQNQREMIDNDLANLPYVGAEGSSGMLRFSVTYKF